MSLRARQKIARQEKILSAAREEFIEHGFSKTNMEVIADKAEVGVATIYTYFESKDGVFANLCRKDMDEILSEVDAAMDELPKNPVEALLAIIKMYSKIYNKMSMELIRDFIIRGKVDGISRDTIYWINKCQIRQIQQALEMGKEGGTVAESLDTDTAAKIVIDLFDYHANRLASDPRHYQSNHRLFTSIRVLFDTWRA